MCLKNRRTSDVMSVLLHPPHIRTPEQLGRLFEMLDELSTRDGVHPIRLAECADNLAIIANEMWISATRSMHPPIYESSREQSKQVLR